MKLNFITSKENIECPKYTGTFFAESVERAVLKITGLGLYRAYLNGKRVGNDWLTPGFNDYSAYLRYQTYDVTELICPGENKLEVYLGKGMYMGRFCFGKGNENIWGDRYLLGARLDMNLNSGAVCCFETDESWKASPSCIRGGNIYDGEIRDDTVEAGEYSPCIRCDWDAPLEEPVSPAVRVRCELKPILIVTPKNEKVLDFGQNFAGVIRFTNRTPRGTVIHIRTGEILQEGCFYNDNLRTAKSEYFYTSDGIVKQIEPFFTFHGFRYAIVEGVEDLDPADFSGLVLSSELRETLKTETDNALLNRLLQNSLWGQRSNFVDVPTDCPQRDERLGWTADTQVFVNTACYQMDCHDFYRKYMKDMRADQVLYGKGNIPQYSPCLKGKGNNGGAVWSDAGTLVPWNVYRNYGDVALLRENYPMMKDYAEYLIRQDRELGFLHINLKAFTFGDWLARDGVTDQSCHGGTNEDYIRAVYYYISIHLTSLAAAELSLEVDASFYGNLAEEIRSSILDEFFAPSGRLCVDTQTGYVLALQFGIYRAKQPVINGLKRRMLLDGYKVKTGFTGTPFLLPVLFENGMADLAYHLILNEQYPGWLACVKLGATTIWERWNSVDENGLMTGTSMNSLNHYAYGSVCEGIYSHIFGLKNAAPGWKKAEIAPAITGRLRRASICYDSPAGIWKVDWRIEDGNRIVLDAQVPEGAEAMVKLYGDPNDTVLTLKGGNIHKEWVSKLDLDHPFLYPIDKEALTKAGEDACKVNG